MLLLFFVLIYFCCCLGLPHAFTCVGSSAYFVAHPPPTRVKLECAFPEGSSEVKWVNTTISTSFGTLEDVVSYAQTLGNNSAVAGVLLSDDMHGRVLTCMGKDHNRQPQYKQYLVLTECEEKLPCLLCIQVC